MKIAAGDGIRSAASNHGENSSEKIHCIYNVAKHLQLHNYT